MAITSVRVAIVVLVVQLVVIQIRAFGENFLFRVHVGICDALVLSFLGLSLYMKHDRKSNCVSTQEGFPCVLPRICW